MENKESVLFIAQIVQHREENYKLLMLIKSGDLSSLYDEEFVKKLEGKIVSQDVQIKQLDKNNLYALEEI